MRKFQGLSYRNRVKRFWHHLRHPMQATVVKPFYSRNVPAWLLDAACYAADVLWVGEGWMWLMRALKPWHRKLTEREIKMASAVFGEALQYRKILIDSRSIVCRHKTIEAFVTFEIINYRQKLDDAVLMHELVHVWQFQHFGAIYLALAWRAHRAERVYDYGGEYGLITAMWEGRQLLDFSVEQQAEIVEYSFRIDQGTEQVSPLGRQAYTYFVRQLHDPLAGLSAS